LGLHAVSLLVRCAPSPRPGGTRRENQEGRKGGGLLRS
jgi:hypothetical protein